MKMERFGSRPGEAHETWRSLFATLESGAQVVEVKLVAVDVVLSGQDAQGQNGTVNAGDRAGWLAKREPRVEMLGPFLIGNLGSDFGTDEGRRPGRTTSRPTRRRLVATQQEPDRSGRFWSRRHLRTSGHSLRLVLIGLLARRRSGGCRDVSPSRRRSAGCAGRRIADASGEIAGGRLMRIGGGMGARTS
jgi:hypothetical protein